MRRKNSQLVLDVLREAGEPMTAYAVIDALRPQGITAPPTVYRALAQLVRTGQVHRIESISSFIACDHPTHTEDFAFTICDDCGNVSELTHKKLSSAMRALAEMSPLKTMRRATVEIHGVCAECAEKGGGSA